MRGKVGVWGAVCENALGEGLGPEPPRSVWLEQNEGQEGRARSQALLQEFGVYSQINLLRGPLKGGEQGDGEIGI